MMRSILALLALASIAWIWTRVKRWDDAVACRETRDGAHAWVHTSEDSAAGRRMFLRCLECGKTSPGWDVPWIGADRTDR